jgi:hypothetical protein
MRMPGFTAEATLWSSYARYWMHRVEAAPVYRVLPAIPPSEACNSICYQADACRRHGDTSSLCQTLEYVCINCHPGGSDPGTSAWASCMMSCLQSGKIFPGKAEQCWQNCQQ